MVIHAGVTQKGSSIHNTAESLWRSCGTLGILWLSLAVHRRLSRVLGLSGSWALGCDLIFVIFESVITYGVQLQHLRAKSTSEPDTDSIAENYTRDAIHIISIIMPTLIIQLPRAYGTYGFNAGSERRIFREVFLWARILLGACRFSERRHERKYFDSYWDRIRDLWYDRPVRCLPRSRS
ncbi:uncharacterized protein [Mycetomoellerius zeteki]|uniref:uncharacterized protein n=1 Tax=Mycetomoellerius zeteki TaxID=64791 RepID=UPI00084EBD34|nr:PREDICTED: uncharacterized protein LOC108731849 [Trachymyrmex zeteki]